MLRFCYHALWGASGQLGPWPTRSESTRSVTNSVPNQLGPWPTRSLSNTVRDQLGPWSTRSVTNSVPIQLGPWPTRSVTNSVPMGKCAQKRLVNFSGKGGVWRLCGWTVDQARPRIDCKPPYNHCVQAVVLCQLGAFESTRTFVNSYLRQLVLLNVIWK